MKEEDATMAKSHALPGEKESRAKLASTHPNVSAVLLVSYITVVTANTAQAGAL